MIWSEEESARALGLIASVLDGYEGGDVVASFDLLLTDVEDWEELSMELAGHAATFMIVIAKILEVEPYEVLKRYVRTQG